MLLTLPRPPPTATSLSSFTATANIPPSTLPPPGDPRTPPGTPNLPLGTPIIAPWNLITAVRTPTNSRRESHHPSPGSPLPPLGTRSFPPQDPHHLPGDPPTPQGLPHASRSDPRTSLGRPPSPVPRAPRAVPAVPVSPLSRCHSCNEPPALSRLRWRSAQTWEAEEGSPPYRPLPPSQAAPLFRLLLPGAPGGAPRARPGGTAALGALLRCFPCERLCGGCGVPPGALPPAMPPPGRRRLPPAARLPPRTFRSYLPRSHRTYSCVHCRAHLARHEELISKSFQGSHGRAYLFNSVVNVGCGPAEQRLLLTGLHSVADIFCQSCNTTLGWKYEQAFESSQKYKEGKFIIEMSHMVKENGWD
ncbi:protein yippee-like 4 isoform X2 [Serinus canaria]|uniref:protein yippee-like 4 isoform X2 n=2 Tax=Carduelinae TaxID=37599 RepID=UPI0021CC7BF3|nr:protein yippee-like 4 isoform X2 [Serinus canaria]